METNIHSTLIRHLIGTDEQQAVDARALHAFLGVGKVFAAWIQERITQFNFVEGIDFARYEGLSIPDSESSKARPQRTIEYALTRDMAKELCMVQNNAKGREARLYYIGIEKEAMALVGDVPRTYSEALRLAADLDDRTKKQQALILELQPKAEFADRVANQIDCMNANEVAKSMGIGSGRLWRFLHDQRIVFRDGRSNVPYQQFIERGYFKVIQKTFKDGNAEERGYTQTLITGKGKIWLQRRWDDVQGQRAAA